MRFKFNGISLDDIKFVYCCVLLRWCILGIRNDSINWIQQRLDTMFSSYKSISASNKMNSIHNVRFPIVICNEFVILSQEKLSIFPSKVRVKMPSKSIGYYLQHIEPKRWMNSFKTVKGNDSFRLYKFINFKNLENKTETLCSNVLSDFMFR